MMCLLAGFYRVLVAAVTCALFACAARAEDVCVVTVEGKELCGQLSLWNADGVVIEQAGPRPIAPAQIASIRFPQARWRREPNDWVILSNGDRIAVSVRKIDGETLTAAWPRSGRRRELTWPLEQVALIHFALPPAPSARRSAFEEAARLQPGSDRARLIAGDDLLGEFQRLEGGLVEWDSSFGSVKLEQQRIRWIGFDPELAARSKLSPTRWTVSLTNGSVFTATDCRPQNDLSLLCVLSEGNEVAIPRHELRSVRRWSPQVVALAQREPVDRQLTPFLTGPRTFEQNRNALRLPLSLRGEEFATGLGVLGQARWSYKLEPGDHAFQAIVGVDDAAEGAGSVRFAIVLDDRVAWESATLTGQSAAVRTPLVSLSGAKTLTLTINRTDRGDTADFANWCDPILYRTP
jgi:hypothetical protein